MPLFRKDPFGAAWVLISPERGLEASDYGSVPPARGGSPLAPGGRRRNGDGARVLAQRPADASRGDGWLLQVLEQPGALVSPRGAAREHAREHDGLFESAPSSGSQELIVEHPDPGRQIDAMSPGHLTEVLKLYRERIELHAARAGVRHVQITRNVGEAAGALYDHPHAQLLAVSVPNRWVEEEREAAERHHAAHGRCLFCDVIDAELRGRERLVSQNAEFVAITPYASRTPFEVWLLPRRHGSAFGRVASNTLPQLAALLQSVVRGMNAALDRPPYNLIVHTLPADGVDSYHWHIEILPRLTRQAGFDWSNGFYVNPTPPEDAARFLREAMALQEVSL